MRCGLGQGIHRNIGAIVASSAIRDGYRTGSPGMVHLPAACERNVILVAGIALCGSWNVVGRLAQRGGAIVAGRAVTRSGRRSHRMIERRCSPSSGRIVASVALSSRADVSRCFGLRVYRNIATTVAG